MVHMYLVVLNFLLVTFASSSFLRLGMHIAIPRVHMQHRAPELINCAATAAA